MMAATNGLVHASTAKPLFTFGVIADVQYADIPDGRSFLGVPRYYRHSISVLQRAVGAWNKQGNIKFSINFGDIVDGFCPKDKSLWAVQKVLEEFDKFDGPTYHMFGNHCLYNLPRSKLVSLLKMPTSSDRAYYDFSPCPEYSHLPMYPGAASPVGLMWNHDEVMAIVRQYNCVKACFAGHDHKGGHSVDSYGVHHRTLEAALECPPGTSAFGHIEAYPDKLLLVGSDGMADTEMCFRFPERALL